MKLLKYLNENDKVPENVLEHVLNLLKKDCAPFLKFLSKNDALFVREDRKFRPVKNDVVKFATRKGRRPKDTPQVIHDLLDAAFKEKFGWNVRSDGVFAYSMPRSTLLKIPSSSVRGVVFVAGTFDLVYSLDYTYYDLYGYLRKIWERHPTPEESLKLALRTSFRDITTVFYKRNKAVIDAFIDKFKRLDLPHYTSSKDITDIINGEVVIKCDSYYLVKYNIVQALLTKAQI